MEPAALFDAALALHRKGSLDEAAALYEQALVAAPDHPGVLNNFGALRMSQGRNEEAAVLWQRLLALRPRMPDAQNNYGTLLRRLGNRAEAIEHFRRATELRPGHPDAFYNLGTTFMDDNRYDLAVEPLLAAAKRSPESPDIWGNLARAMDAAGRREEALIYGERTLRLKDKAACDGFAASGGQPLAGIPPRPFDPAKPERNVIAFSLWGDRRFYTEGAVANAELQPAIYPGWTCRFYVDRDVPAEVVARLKDRGAEVVPMTMTMGPVEGLFWRFLVADDPGVDRFLCRDCDARLNSQEQAAVAAWIASGKPFHSMRDAPFHTELILAGLWGGLGGVLGGMEARWRAFYKPHHSRWSDQDFVRLEIWPRIKSQLLTHDSYYRINGAVDFPPEGRRIRPYHVGAGEAV